MLQCLNDEMFILGSITVGDERYAIY